MAKLKVLDLFSGIGGFSYGLDKAGMETVIFCEQDDECKKVLRHHWPEVPIFNDVRDLNKKMIDAYSFESERCARSSHEISAPPRFKNIDLICGGYPCTGHSMAGKKEGFKDERSALWREYHRLAREIKPKYCIIENSANLRGTGLVELLKAFHEIGYNAEWSCLSGYSVGAPHQRERLYIVLWRAELPYCNPFRWWQADPKKEKATQGWWSKRLFKRSPVFKQASKVVSRVLQFDDGVSKEVLNKNKIKIEQLGNSLVPQIPELIGRAIVEHEQKIKSTIN